MSCEIPMKLSNLTPTLGMALDITYNPDYEYIEQLNEALEEVLLGNGE